MVAACRTVKAARNRALSITFCPATRDPDRYQVERCPMARAIRPARVTAIQHGNEFFRSTVSFYVEEEGAFNHQDRMPDVPPPDKLTAEEVAKHPIFSEMPISSAAITSPIARSSYAPWNSDVMLRPEDRRRSH